jgi:hypothetical protein
LAVGWRPPADPGAQRIRVRILGGFYAPPGARRVWRELELTADQTLADLGDAIPLAFGFDDPHLWWFFLSGKPWDRSSEYARPGTIPLDDPKRAAHDLPIPQAPAEQGVPVPVRLRRRVAFGARCADGFRRL